MWVIIYMRINNVGGQQKKREREIVYGVTTDL